MPSKQRIWAANPTVVSFDEAAAAESRERQRDRANRKAVHAKRQQKKKKEPLWREFYRTKEWKEARYRALKRSDGRCACCGASAKDGAKLNVDHIKALTKRPDLGLKQSNLQVLCSDCNAGKGWRDETDWR